MVSDASRSDEELVTRSRTGDVDSFNQLILRWERPIYALAYRVIGREEEARDVVQETFLKLLQHLRGRGETTNLRAWLFTVAANASRDRLRGRRRWLPWQAEFDERPAPVAAVEYDLKRADDALRGLAPRDRLLLSLRVHGLSYREIASAAGIRESSVGRLLARAVGRWKQRVERLETAR